eukprot:TRINITY_DN6204_c0_g2_i1.p1 TRINITY_DN6204_c0_g2~~TRINITY_DN6204_c0_g2_i1.p1  ORF type:complete len:420 (-),score=65.72 TRINITY_DN6204_c0_g2_i1:515-1774(-)
MDSRMRDDPLIPWRILPTIPPQPPTNPPSAPRNSFVASISQFTAHIQDMLPPFRKKTRSDVQSLQRGVPSDFVSPVPTQPSTLSSLAYSPQTLAHHSLLPSIPSNHSLDSDSRRSGGATGSDGRRSCTSETRRFQGLVAEPHGAIPISGQPHSLSRRSSGVSDRASTTMFGSDSDGAVDISQHFLFPSLPHSIQDNPHSIQDNPHSIQDNPHSIQDNPHFHDAMAHDNTPYPHRAQQPMQDVEMHSDLPAPGFAPTSPTMTNHNLLPHPIAAKPMSRSLLPSLHQGPALPPLASNHPLPTPSWAQPSQHQPHHPPPQPERPLLFIGVGMDDDAIMEISRREGKRILSCPYDGCDKTFHRQDHLKKHILTHTGEKPFACNQCSKRFARLDKLKDHQQTHVGVHIYKCQICHQDFPKKRFL